MISKPLSCKIKKSDVQLDYENIIIKYIDGYEVEIKKMISIIHDEIGDIWDDIWTWDDVVDRFKKGHFLWLVLDEDSPIACSWFEKKSKKDLYIYNTYLIPELRGKGLTEKIFSICKGIIACARNHKIKNFQHVYRLSYHEFFPFSPWIVLISL